MHLTLHLTNRCNLACRYCYAAHGHEDMTFDTACRAITELGDEENCGVVFFGGEPLLQRELMFQIIEWCDDQRPGHYHYKVTTNGTLMDGAFVARALAADLLIALSHDGIGQAHDQHRVCAGGDGTAADLEEKLKLLLAHCPYAPVMQVVTPETVDSFADSVQWLHGQGVRYLITSMNYAGDWTKRTLRRLKREYRKLADWYVKIITAEDKMYFSPFDKRIASHIRPGLGVSCQLGQRQISIGPGGTYYPCVQFVGRDEFAIGNVVDGINHARRQELYRCNERHDDTCLECSLSDRCHCRCACLNLQVTGNYQTIPPLLCEYERMLIPIADDVGNRLFAKRSPMFLQRHYNELYPILSYLEDIAR